MSRSNYSDDLEDNWQLIRWRGAVRSAIRGARGQALLRDMLAALDALPVKELHQSVLVEDGKCCAMGAVAVHRGIDVSDIDPYDSETVAGCLGVSEALVREIAWHNDEWSPFNESPAKRWARMRTWVVASIVEERAPAQPAHQSLRGPEPR